MSNIWFCSDLHFGHNNIQRYRKEVISEEHNRTSIVLDWQSSVKKKDTVYVLGDACFTLETLPVFGNLAGKKILIRGNHDELPAQEYLKYFDEVYGIIKYKGYWLSHAPIHPNELRDKQNIHGHVHYNSVDSPWYVNACVENVSARYQRALMNLDEVRRDFPKPETA